jgi:hypothetical protein
MPPATRSARCPRSCRCDMRRSCTIIAALRHAVVIDQRGSRLTELAAAALVCLLCVGWPGAKVIAAVLHSLAGMWC